MIPPCERLMRRPVVGFSVFPMPCLPNPRHEQFAQAVARGLSAKDAYLSAGFAAGGATQSASRLLRNANISARVKELQDTQVERVISLEVKERNNRIALLQHKLEQLDMLIAARAADMKDLPGGTTGLLCRDYKGKDANQLVLRYDSAVVQDYLAILKQVAIETGQWVAKRSEKVSVDLQIRARLESARQRLRAEGVTTIDTPPADAELPPIPEPPQLR